MSSNNNNEDEIAVIQKKIKGLKIIVIKAQEMREELIKLFIDSGTEIDGVEYYNLLSVGTQIEHRLNALRISLAKLRSE